MKHSKMKKVLSATVALMMIGASIPLTVNAAGFDWSGFAGGFWTTKSLPSYVSYSRLA